MPVFWLRYTHVTFLLPWRATDLEMVWRKKSFMYCIVCKSGSLTGHLGDWVYLNRTAVDIEYVLNRRSLCADRAQKSLEIQHWSYLLIFPTLSFCSSSSCPCQRHTSEWRAVLVHFVLTGSWSLPVPVSRDLHHGRLSCAAVMVVFQMGRQEHIAAGVTPCKPCRTWGVSCRGHPQPLGSEKTQQQLQLAGRKWGAGDMRGRK